MAENNTVSVGQLSSVATSMKTYIDAKDKVNSDAVAEAKGAADDAMTQANKGVNDAAAAKAAAEAAQAAIDQEVQDRNDAIDAAKTAIEEKLPGEATAAEIKGITDMFAVGE